MIVVEEERSRLVEKIYWRWRAPPRAPRNFCGFLMQIRDRNQRFGLRSATLPVPGLHAGLHVQVARLPEVAFQREGRISGCDQLWVVLDHHDVGVEITIPDRLALVQLEVHLHCAGSLAGRWLHEARRRLLVEAATSVHHTRERLLRLQHHVHGVRSALEVNLLNALVAALDFKGVRKVLFPDFCNRAKQFHA